MQKALTDREPAEFDTRGDVGRAPALLWGGFCGAIIGIGISLSIGLFYNEDIFLVLAVVVISLLFGVLFGHMFASLLADNVILNARAADNPVILPVVPSHMIDLAEHRKLQDKKRIEIVQNQPFAESSSPAPSRQMVLPDLQLFQRIVECAHSS